MAHSERLMRAGGAGIEVEYTGFSGHTHTKVRLGRGSLRDVTSRDGVR